MKPIDEQGSRLRELRNQMDDDDMVPDLADAAADGVNRAVHLIDRIQRL